MFDFRAPDKEELIIYIIILSALVLIIKYIYNMKQVNQKAISAKLDMEVYAEMDLFCKVKDIKRNRLINLALTEYMSNHKV